MRDMCTKMHYYLYKRRLEQIRTEVEERTKNINQRDENGRTALMYCCYEENQEWALGITRMLLQVPTIFCLTYFNKIDSLLPSNSKRLFQKAIIFNCKSLTYLVKVSVQHTVKTANRGRSVID